MTHDRLPAFAREAHSRMLDAFDRFASGLLTAEREAMTRHLRETGMTPERAAQGALAHVERIKAKLDAERARLEAEAARLH